MECVPEYWPSLIDLLRFADFMCFAFLNRHVNISITVTSTTMMTVTAIPAATSGTTKCCCEPPPLSLSPHDLDDEVSIHVGDGGRDPTLVIE